MQTGNIPSTTHTQISPQQPTYGINLTPYSTQKYLVPSQSSPIHSNNLFDTQLNNESSIQKSYTDMKSTIFYGKKIKYLK